MSITFPRISTIAKPFIWWAERIRWKWCMWRSRKVIICTRVWRPYFKYMRMHQPSKCSRCFDAFKCWLWNWVCFFLELQSRRFDVFDWPRGNRKHRTANSFAGQVEWAERSNTSCVPIVRAACTKSTDERIFAIGSRQPQSDPQYKYCRDEFDHIGHQVCHWQWRGEASCVRPEDRHGHIEGDKNLPRSSVATMWTRRPRINWVLLSNVHTGRVSFDAEEFGAGNFAKQYRSYGKLIAPATTADRFQ